MNTNTNPNFKRGFDELYKIAMFTADTCIGQKSLEARMEKLHEEFLELNEAFYKLQQFELAGHQHAIIDGKNHADFIKEMKSEFGDVLFVLMHIAHKLNTTPFELLHGAASKMLKRMNDSKYQARN